MYRQRRKSLLCHKLYTADIGHHTSSSQPNVSEINHSPNHRITTIIMSNCSNSNTPKCCEPPKKACPPPAPPPCTNLPATLTFACPAEECKPVPKPPCPEKPKDDCTCIGAASACEEPKPKNNNSGCK